MAIRQATTSASVIVLKTVRVPVGDGVRARGKSILRALDRANTRNPNANQKNPRRDARMIGPRNCTSPGIARTRCRSNLSNAEPAIAPKTIAA